MKSVWRAVINFAILCNGLSSTDWTAENSSFSYKLLTLLQNIESLFWGHIRIDGSFQPYSSCYVNSLKCDNYVKGFQSNITCNLGTCTSFFTILSVTVELHNSMWYNQLIFKTSPNNETRYGLKVYASAVSPCCDPVSLLDNVNFQIKCATRKVFPEAMCLFYRKKNNYDTVIELLTGSINYTTDVSSTARYIKTECTYIVSAAILGPGSHDFFVVMYPNISSNITEEMKRSSPYTVPVVIGYPKAALSADCYVKDFIKENETSTCTCYDSNTSFLPTRVTWSIGDSNNGTLHFTARRHSNSVMSFQCTVSNTLNFTSVIIYQPRVAYPPDISLTLNKTELDLCLDKNLDIIGNCFVGDNYPASLVAIYINNVLLDANRVSKTTEHTFNTTYTSSGVVNVTCLAYNEVFSVGETKYLTIKGAPERPNIFKLVRQDTLSSKEKIERAFIMCQSRGGVPSSKQLSLTCDNMETQTTNSDAVTLEVNMTRIPTDLNCTCIVFHDSKCLQPITTESLRLYLSDDSRPVEVNTAAIAVGVTLGLGLLVSIGVHIFIIIRNKRIKGNESAMKENTKKRQDYNNVGATPYVNTEMHGYETANIRPSYSNEVTTTSRSQSIDKPNIFQNGNTYVNDFLLLLIVKETLKKQL